MTDSQTISWIFMATAIACETEPSGFKEISMIADGINKSIPTHKEMQTSIVWLSIKGLLMKNGKKYHLTPKGKAEYEKASESTNVLFNIWDNLEKEIKNYT